MRFCSICVGCPFAACRDPIFTSFIAVDDVLVRPDVNDPRRRSARSLVDLADCDPPVCPARPEAGRGASPSRRSSAIGLLARALSIVTVSAFSFSWSSLIFTYICTNGWRDHCSVDLVVDLVLHAHRPASSPLRARGQRLHLRRVVRFGAASLSRRLTVRALHLPGGANQMRGGLGAVGHRLGGLADVARVALGLFLPVASAAAARRRRPGCLSRGRARRFASRSARSSARSSRCASPPCSTRLSRL